MQGRQSVQQRHAEFPDCDDEELPCAPALDHGDNGHDNAQDYADTPQDEIELGVGDFLEWPEGFTPEPKACNGVVRQDVRCEPQGAERKTVALKLVKGYVLLEQIIPTP